MEIHITGLISLTLPVNTLRITHVSIPNIIPFAMEYVRGIKVIATNAPIVPATSLSKSMFLTALNMRRPTKIIAGAVANEGIAVKIGANTMEIRNITAVVKAVRPVQPPAETPALDST